MTTLPWTRRPFIAHTVGAAAALQLGAARALRLNAAELAAL
jgi:hypothetical protein